MSQVLRIHTASRTQRGPKAVSLARNLTSCAVSGMWLTVSLTGVLAIATLLSLARLL